jgi:hypothetical protein
MPARRQTNADYAPSPDAARPVIAWAMGNFNHGLQTHSNGHARAEMVSSGSDQPTNGQNGDTPGKPLYTLVPLLAVSEWAFVPRVLYDLYVLFLIS